MIAATFDKGRPDAALKEHLTWLISGDIDWLPFLYRIHVLGREVRHDFLMMLVGAIIAQIMLVMPSQSTCFVLITTVLINRREGGVL